jgi:hypothetical protein
MVTDIWLEDYSPISPGAVDEDGNAMSLNVTYT